MTDFEKFKEALEALCKEHGYCLTTTGYDHIVATDLRNGEEPIYGGLEEAGW